MRVRTGNAASWQSVVLASTLVVSLLLLVLAVVVLPVLAGPLTNKGTQPPLGQILKPPSDCGGCHGGYDGARNIEPFDTWSGSMMAQAGRDPIFWAALDVANRDIPNVGDFCLRCHVPAGWLAGRSEPPGGSTDGCRFEGKLDEKDKDFDGLTCHVCHRMMVNPNPPAGQQPVYYENGQFWLDDGTCGGMGEPCRRGPYNYPPNPAPPHAYAFSQYHVDSDNCGNCHNVTHPTKTLIRGGVNTGVPMPIERTFKEWQQSSYAPIGTDFKTCQNCHMPDQMTGPVYACSDQIQNRAGNLPVHRFAGGNAWIPDVLRQEYPNLNLANEFNATKAWALDMLQNQSATVEVSVPANVTGGGTLDARVRVTNRTGHKLPTGYPEGRRMWLHVQARSATGTVFWESGAYNAATGDLAGDPQRKVYETKPGIWNRNGTQQCDTVDGIGRAAFHFVLNDCIAKDNRIPPKGFTGGGDLETQPVAYTYPETAPGSGRLVHWDDTNYAIPVPAGTASPVTVTASLKYQTISKDYANFLNDQAVENNFPNDCIERSTGFPTLSRGELLYGMWTRHGRSAPVDMGTAQGQSAVVSATPGEASATPSDQMLVTAYDRATGDLTISYAPPCQATNHTVHWGNLASVASYAYSGEACNVGASGTARFNPGTGSVFFLVVADDGTWEGSYGRSSAGAERPRDASVNTCVYAQDLARRCD